MDNREPMGRCRDIGVVKDTVYFAEGGNELDFYAFSCKDGKLVRTSPPWNQNESMAKMS